MANVADRLDPALAAKLRDRSLSWTDRRPIVADAIGTLVEMSVGRIGESLVTGRARDFREFCVGFGILIDKNAQLLGEPNVRIESTNRTERLNVTIDGTDAEVRERIEQLRAEMPGSSRSALPEGGQQ